MVTTAFIYRKTGYRGHSHSTKTKFWKLLTLPSIIALEAVMISYLGLSMNKTKGTLVHERELSVF